MADIPRDTSEPIGYREWRELLTTDPMTALKTVNPGQEHYECMLFWFNTEARMLRLSDIRNDVIFGWEMNGEAVWVLDATEETQQQFLYLFGEELLSWFDAMKNCGATYYEHWRDCPYIQTLIKLDDPEIPSRPWLVSKSLFEKAPVDEAGKQSEEVSQDLKCEIAKL